MMRSCFVLRFIPTHVGNTSQVRASQQGFAVHPHARGEHEDAGRWQAPVVGSSPRTWGTLADRRAEYPSCRFIPTHVGNTPRLASCTRARPVHPHARGEHWSWWVLLLSDGGSSPRTWGTPRTLIEGDWLFRFIPTHVGNTRGHAPACPGQSVHPHARGEHAR